MLIKLRVMDGQFTELQNILKTQKNIPINTIIDIGASNGCWSDAVKRIFHDSFYYLIEANNVHQKALEKFKSKNKNSDYIIAAAGNSIGEIYFDNSDLFGGVASREKQSVIVPSTTVDHCVAENKLKGPFLLKLDTHGFEVPILEGAKNTLTECNLLVIEVYNFKITKESLPFYELCDYLYKIGFHCLGLIEIMYRPKDNILWQFDLIFAPKTRKEFLDNNYN